MSEGQMNTIALWVPMLIEVNKGPNKNGLGAEFGPGVIIWEGLAYKLELAAQCDK